MSAFVGRALVLAAAAALGGAGPVFSAGAAVQVTGASAPSDCGAAKSASYSAELSGSLVGCMASFVTSSNCQEVNGYSLYNEIGREEFDGTLDGEAVTFQTSYNFTGFWPAGSCANLAPEKEIVGGCIHYISGDSVFGEIRFFDELQGEGAPFFPYVGTLARQ